MGAITKVMIGGTDVSSYLVEYEVQDSNEDVVDNAQLVFTSELQQAIDITSGSALTIQRGSDSSNLKYIHRGYLDGWTNNNGYIDINSPNKLWKLQQMEVTTSYDKDNDPEAGVISDIMIDLVTTHGGLTADSTTVPDSSTLQGQKLRKFILEQDNLLEGIQALAGVLGWQIHYRPEDDKVYVQPEGYTTHVTTLNFGPGTNEFHLRIPVVERDYSQIINVVDVVGARQFQEGIVESFTASASQTAFTLANPPEGTEVTVDGTAQTRGNYDEGDTDSYDYVVDRATNQVIFNNALTGGETVNITYSANVPVPVRTKNQESIETHTDGEERKKTFVFNDVISINDAELRAQRILEKYSTPFLKYMATVAPSFPIVRPGHKMKIVDTVNGVEQEMVVRVVRRKWPEFEDQITFADRRLIEVDNMTQILYRLEKLEKEAVRNQSFLRHLFSFNHDVKAQRRSVKFFKKGVSADVGTWGDASSDWGTATWGRNGNPEVLAQVWQGNNVYREHVYDSEFIDSGETTCTVDTSNRRFIN